MKEKLNKEIEIFSNRIRELTDLLGLFPGATIDEILAEVKYLKNDLLEAEKVKSSLAVEISDIEEGRDTQTQATKSLTTFLSRINGRA